MKSPLVSSGNGDDHLIAGDFPDIKTLHPFPRTRGAGPCGQVESPPVKRAENLLSPDDSVGQVAAPMGTAIFNGTIVTVDSEQGNLLAISQDKLSFIVLCRIPDCNILHAASVLKRCWVKISSNVTRPYRRTTHFIITCSRTLGKSELCPVSQMEEGETPNSEIDAQKTNKPSFLLDFR